MALSHPIIYLRRHLLYLEPLLPLASRQGKTQESVLDSTATSAKIRLGPYKSTTLDSFRDPNVSEIRIET